MKVKISLSYLHPWQHTLLVFSIPTITLKPNNAFRLNCNGSKQTVMVPCGGQVDAKFTYRNKPRSWPLNEEKVSGMKRRERILLKKRFRQRRNNIVASVSVGFEVRRVGCVSILNHGYPCVR
jgi:hypothetical protein